jgi:hypothetical protein
LALDEIPEEWKQLAVDFTPMDDERLAECNPESMLSKTVPMKYVNAILRFGRHHFFAFPIVFSQSVRLSISSFVRSFS